MSDKTLSAFLRTQAHEHYEGIIKMGYKGKVEALKLWKAADRIDELEAEKEILRITCDAHIDQLDEGDKEAKRLNAVLDRLGEGLRFIEPPAGYMHEWHSADYLKEIQMRMEYARNRGDSDD